MKELLPATWNAYVDLTNNFSYIQRVLVPGVMHNFFVLNARQ